MNTVTYAWGGMWGTFNVPCVVKQVTANECEIEFYDTVAERTENRTVEKSTLTFPAFADLIM